MLSCFVFDVLKLGNALYLCYHAFLRLLKGSFKKKKKDFWKFVCFFPLKLYEGRLLKVMGTWIASKTSSTDAYVLARYGFMLNLFLKKY